MGSRDRRVDAYIAKSAEFARPILEHLREVVHSACPEVAETIKWGMPFFVRGAPLCHMAAFKHHCAFGFWKGARVTGVASGSKGAMGQFGRILSTADLPSRRSLAGLVRSAARLAGTGAVAAARRRRPRPAPRAPADLRAALARNARALATFRALPPSGRREYVDWLLEAKRKETRTRRLAEAVRWLAAGKARNWRYGA